MCPLANMVRGRRPTVQQEQKHAGTVYHQPSYYSQQQPPQLTEYIYTEQYKPAHHNRGTYHEPVTV